MIELLKDLGILIGIPLLRSISGWLSIAFRDKRITKFELRKLLSTIIKVGTMGFFAYIGFSMVGLSNPAIAGGIASFFADKILDSIKENKSLRG